MPDALPGRPPRGAGEPAEHVGVLHALAGERLTGALPTYRGEGRPFG
ncbi:hypothetical protein [Blastococcus sp. SYSU DS0619]